MVVLEGGYDLNALSASSEAVVETLRVHPNDQEGIDQLLTRLHAENRSEEGKA